jgi:hypothetical protein
MNKVIFFKHEKALVTAHIQSTKKYLFLKILHKASHLLEASPSPLGAPLLERCAQQVIIRFSTTGSIFVALDI